MARIPTAFFGGSFDPPHLGHLQLARAALALGGCERVVWVPSYSPPHKQKRERAPFDDRLAMVELMIRNEPCQHASDIERRLALEPSYTIDVMAACSSAHPELELKLLIGGDSLLELHTWHRARELVDRYLILTYPRANPGELRDQLAEHWNPEQVEKLLAGVMTGKIFEISSSEIKKRMAKSPEWSDINTGALAEPVREYCRAHRLYTTAEEVKCDHREIRP